MPLSRLGAPRPKLLIRVSGGGEALPECGSFSLHTLTVRKSEHYIQLRKAGDTWYLQAKGWHTHTDNSKPNHRELEAEGKGGDL